MISVSHAFLLITPAHTHHNLLWERVLIVFDPMTDQQTTITQVAISGSPKSFAILILKGSDTTCPPHMNDGVETITLTILLS